MAVNAVTQNDILSRTGAMSFSPDQDFTITLWFKVNALPGGGDWKTCLAIFPSPALDSEVWLGILNTGKFKFSVLDGNGSSSVSSASTFTTNTWYGVAATYSADTDVHSLYQISSGNLTTEGTFTYNQVAMTGSLRFSLLSDTDSHSKPGGSLAYVRVWQRLLSETQILRELSSPSLVDSRQLVGDWPLTSIADVTDHGSLGYNLTLTGDVATVAGPAIQPRLYKQWRIYRMDAKPRDEEKA